MFNSLYFRLKPSISSSTQACFPFLTMELSKQAFDAFNRKPRKWNRPYIYKAGLVAERMRWMMRRWMLSGRGRGTKTLSAPLGNDKARWRHLHWSQTLASLAPWRLNGRSSNCWWCDDNIVVEHPSGCVLHWINVLFKRGSAIANNRNCIES